MSDFPRSIIFVGQDEILLDDSRRLDNRLREAGVRSEINIAKGMWHAYILYGLRENRDDERKIRSFIWEIVNE